MSEKPSTTLLIVEDQQITRLGLRVVLEKFNDIEIIGEAETGYEAIDKVSSLGPRVVLMDIGLPELDGIEATKQIKTQSTAKVLMLTTHDHDLAIFASLAAGADGYCLKDAPPQQIAMAIRVVSEGATYLHPAIAQRVFQACKPETSQGDTRRSRDNFELSPRELEVLGLIVKGQTNNEIAARLVLSIDTVKTHVRHIMEKLAVSDRTQAAVKALRTGLVSDKS